MDENRVSPFFCFRDIHEAHNFVQNLQHNFEAIRAEVECTTRHGKLLRLECHPIGREVIVNFCYYTADAHGMNMIVKATDRACQWIMNHSCAQHYYLFSGFSTEKRARGCLFLGGKGKKVMAGALVPARVVQAYLHTSPERLVDMWHNTVLGHAQANTMGYNGHYANGLTAIFIACGQDVPNVANAAVGLTNFEMTT
ncbi:hypothetical protein C2W62_07295 [Candidatus Entotheonella serta]|nr:hypothetical protein C2W62_07295 [Candidatus Entotheonella serta]